ncbi:hypothetical protein [Actinomadura fibrosa]|uniref:Uncharacterized protein n=1 Tax=Actinomadura fibrosa TaxID=111802 RepID=A0ABW2XWL1_9ACTN|nr:hypothetical protein [Actinomadura fibrosa]
MALPALRTVRVHSRTAEHRERLAASIAASNLACQAVVHPTNALTSSHLVVMTDRGYDAWLSVRPLKDGALVTSILPLTCPPPPGRCWCASSYPPCTDPIAARPAEIPPHGPPGAASGWSAAEVDATPADVLRRAEPDENVLYDQRGQFGRDHPLVRWASESGAGVPFESA